MMEFLAKNLNITTCCALLFYLVHTGYSNYIAYGCTGTYLHLNCSTSDQFVVVKNIYYELSQEENCHYTHVKCSHRVTDPAIHICTGFQTCRWLIPSYSISNCGKSDQAVISYVCVKVSAVSDICDDTLSVLEERQGYIASPGYTDLHSATSSIVIGQYQAPYRCTLTVQVPPGHGYAALHFYVKDLDFRSSHGPTTPTDSERDNQENEQNGKDTCIKLTEILANNIRGNVQIFCSLRDVKTHGPVFRSTSFHVEITYWTINEDFSDFLLHFVAIMDKKTTIPTLPAHAALRDQTTKRSTVLATESQIYSPTPAGSLTETTTTQSNASGWDNPFDGQRETKPWATAVGAAIGCIAAVLLVALIVVLIVEKRRKRPKKDPRIYDEVPHPDDRSQKNSELNQEIYENMHAHTNAGFVDELNDIMKKNVQTPKKSPKGTTDKLQNKSLTTANHSGPVAKTESLEANMDVEEICDNEAYYEDSEPIKAVAEHLEKTSPIVEENIYVNHDALPDCDTNGSKEIVEEPAKVDIPGRKHRYSPQIDLEKAQEIYENAAFPVKYSRIATPRICERSRQDSKKGKPPARKGYNDTVQPVLQKLERPKVAIRRNPSALSESELIYDDVPDEAAEDEAGDKPVKPALKPKPRLSKILKSINKNKTPSPKLKSVADDTIMIDNELYTDTS